MAIKLYNSSIKDVYAGDNKIKSVYVGDNLVYSAQSGIEIDPLYNYFVFDTSKVSNSTTVTLQNYRAGDSTTWDGLTDWGDGTIDSNRSHTYASDGVYTVKTKYMINNNTTGNSNTRKMLINCTGINSNVTTAMYMFYGCTSLTSLDLSNFNTSKVTNMSYMFQDCSKLTSLNLSNFDTSNVIDMSRMFYNCSLLTSLDLSSFNTGNVTSLNRTFYYCSSLLSVNLSNFHLNKDTDVYYMFFRCKSLNTYSVNMTNCDSITKEKINEGLSYIYY